MGRIYEGTGDDKIKLSMEQVLEKLKGEMSDNQRVRLGISIKYHHDKGVSKVYRRLVVHGILDAYAEIDGQDEITMSVKKCLKHILTKVMNGSTQGSDGAFQAFAEWAMQDA